MISLFVLALEFILLAVLKLFGVEEQPNLLIFILIIAFSFAFITNIRTSETTKKYAQAFIFGFFERLSFMFFDLFGSTIYTLPNSGGDANSYFYHCVRWSSTGEMGRGGYFSIILGTVFKVAGVSRMLGQFIIVLFSIVALVFLAKTLNYIDVTDSTKQKAMMIISILPNFAILSSIFLRESIITMILSVSFYYLVRWFKEKGERYFWFAFALAFVGALFHSGAVGVAWGYIVIRFLYDKGKSRFGISARTLIPAFVFLFIFAFLFLNYGENFFSKIFNIDSIEEIATVVERGDSSYAQYVGDSSTPLNMVIYTVPRMVYFLFSPFPWQWRGFSDIIAFIFSSMFFLWTSVRVIKYLRRKETANRTLVIALSIVAVCTLFIFGWGTSNAGTACRHRDKAIILYGILWCCTTLPERRIALNEEGIGYNPSLQS